MGHPIRGTVDDLVARGRASSTSTPFIVALPLNDDRRLVETLNRLCQVPVNVRLCPDAFGLRLGQVQASHIGRPHLPQRHRSAVERLAVDRQADRGPRAGRG